MSNRKLNSIIKKVLLEVEQPTIGCVEGVCKNGEGKFVQKQTNELGTFIDTSVGDFGNTEGKLQGEGSKITKSLYNTRAGSMEEINEGTFSNGKLIDGTRETKSSKNYMLEVGKFVNSKLEGQGTMTLIRQGSEVVASGEFKEGNLKKGKVKYEFDGFAINVQSDNIRGNMDYTFIRPVITTPKGKKYEGYSLDVYGKSMTFLKNEGGMIKDFEKYIKEKDNESADIVQKESVNKRKVKLKESDLVRIVKQVIKNKIN